jgi:O-acetylserine/cysteine efflux transporter
MPFKHILLLVLIMATWGANFTAIQIGLKSFPPLLFSASRFFVVIFPAIFFVKKPSLPVSKLALFGLLMFVGQFAFLFSAMHVGLSAGLASLLLQMQAFFTIGLAAFFLHNRPALFQILGALIAATGVAVVGVHTGGDVTGMGLCLVTIAALCWGGANVLAKTFGRVDMFGVVVWGSLFAFPPLALLSLFIEGPETIVYGFSIMTPVTFLALAYIVYLSTFACYPAWGRMLVLYDAAIIAPFTLLVPAFGMLSATIFLGETYPLWKLWATLLILAGLVIGNFWERVQKHVFSRSIP